MKTFVEFRSTKFPPYEGEEEQIIPEDWGWYVPIKNEGFRLAVCCEHQYGEENEFQCFTDPPKPIVRKLFKKIDATEPLTRLSDALQAILSEDPDIADVSWSEP